MKIHAAILDKYGAFKQDLFKKLLSTFPNLSIDISINSFEAIKDLSASNPPFILFFDPKEHLFNDFIPIEKSSLKFESILVVDNLKDDFPFNQFRPSGFVSPPFNTNFLISTVETAKKILNNKIIPTLKFPANRIAIPTNDGLAIIGLNDIIRCESLNGCTRIVTTTTLKNIISSYNIGVYKKLLKDSYFFSPHKSHLINLFHVSYYKREGIIFMNGETKSSIPVARNKKAQFLCLLKNM